MHNLALKHETDKAAIRKHNNSIQKHSMKLYRLLNPVTAMRKVRRIVPSTNVAMMTPVSSGFARTSEDHGDGLPVPFLGYDDCESSSSMDDDDEDDVIHWDVHVSEPVVIDDDIPVTASTATLPSADEEPASLPHADDVEKCPLFRTARVEALTRELNASTASIASICSSILELGKTHPYDQVADAAVLSLYECLNRESTRNRAIKNLVIKLDNRFKL